MTAKGAAAHAGEETGFRPLLVAQCLREITADDLAFITAAMGFMYGAALQRGDENAEHYGRRCREIGKKLSVQK